MKAPKIKSEYKKKVVGFNNSATPLGSRKDLIVLAEMALTSGNPNLINLFEELPTLEEIQAKKAKDLVEEAKK